MAGVDQGDETREVYWSYASFLLPFVTPYPDDAPMYEKLASIGLKGVYMGIFDNVPQVSVCRSHRLFGIRNRNSPCSAVDKRPAQKEP